MRNTWFSVMVALSGVATLAGCRVASHSSWGQPKPACPPQASSDAMSPGVVSVDPPASSELVPLPTRPVFGSRMDGRQAGILEPPMPPPSAESPQPEEQIAAPPPDAVGAGKALKLRRSDLPDSADQ